MRRLCASVLLVRGLARHHAARGVHPGPAGPIAQLPSGARLLWAAWDPQLRTVRGTSSAAGGGAPRRAAPLRLPAVVPAGVPGRRSREAAKPGARGMRAAAAAGIAAAPAAVPPSPRRAAALASTGCRERRIATRAAASVSAVAPACLDERGRFQGEFRPQPSEFPQRLLVWRRLWARQQEELAAREKHAIQVTLPNGSIVEGRAWVTTPLEIAKGISMGLAKAAVVAMVTYDAPRDVSLQCVAADDDEDDDEEEGGGESDGVLWDLSRPLEASCRLELIKFDDPRGRETFWHSSSHILGQALEARFGGLLTIGPAVEGGFYYDMYLGGTGLSESDFPAIEEEMSKLRRADEPFERLVLSRDEALELFDGNPFKVDLIRRKVPEGAMTSAYRCGSLIDLCRGPHISSTGQAKSSVAASRNAVRGHRCFGSKWGVRGFSSAKKRELGLTTESRLCLCLSPRPACFSLDLGLCLRGLRV